MSPRPNSLVSSSGSGRKVRQLRETPEVFHKSLCESCGEAQRKRMLLRREWAQRPITDIIRLTRKQLKRRGLL